MSTRAERREKVADIIHDGCGFSDFPRPCDVCESIADRIMALEDEGAQEPYAWEMLFRSKEAHGDSWEGNGEITRNKAKAEEDGRAMVEFGFGEWCLLELFTARPPTEEETP